MKINQFILNKWYQYSFPISNKIITKNLIKKSLNCFKADLLINLSTYFNTPSQISEKYYFNLFIIFKIRGEDEEVIRSISTLQIIKFEDFNKLIDIFYEFWSLKEEDYLGGIYSGINFTYKISLREKKDVSLPSSKIQKPFLAKEKKYKHEKFGGYDLPNTMDFKLWGNYHFIDKTNVIVYKKGSMREYHIELFENYHKVEIILNDVTLISFRDELINKSDLSSFKRNIGNHEYIYLQGKREFLKIKKNTSFLKVIKKSSHQSKKIITMDLETRVINGKMNAYCVSIFDGKEFKSFYLSDFASPKSMIRESIIFLLKRKYHSYKVYLHNFSNFDSIFMLSVLTELSDNISPIIKDGRFIDLRFKFANKYNLYFRDSYLLLPASLKSLAKNFNVTNKGFFPYNFVNQINTALDYVGSVPDLKYFSFQDLSKEDYLIYSKNFNFNWSLKKETIKYCELDCKVLYEILDKFSDNIFESFRINITNYPTLPSLAFAIFRSNFLINSKIPLLTGKIYEYIKKSYTGGSVDVYTPRPICNKKIYRYDVNSLYPYVMKYYPMPIGNPKYFEGDILNKDLGLNYENDLPFGIFEVDITCPNNIKIPLLQKRLKVNGGYRTIAPVGTWTGHYFSDELYNAKKYGYSFKIKSGYLFEKGDIFSSYIDYFYKLKKNSNKNSPNYMISKLLLNSLYGRLGMKPYTEEHKILNNNESETSIFYFMNDVTDVLDLKNGKLLVTFFPKKQDVSESGNSFKNVSIVVSSLVTASSRIHMSKFKTNKNIKIYYSDTDSIDVDSELEKSEIGIELGQMKLEHIFEDAIFLCPKVYAGKATDYEFVRVKGLKNPIKFNEFIPLLQKNQKIEVLQEKWFKDMSDGIFNIKDEIYTLMVTGKKRKLLYNNDNIFYDTLPLMLENGKIID